MSRHLIMMMVSTISRIGWWRAMPESSARPKRHYTLNKEALKVLKAYREYLRRIGAVKKPRGGQG